MFPLLPAVVMAARRRTGLHVQFRLRGSSYLWSRRRGRSVLLRLHALILLDARRLIHRSAVRASGAGSFLRHRVHAK